MLADGGVCHDPGPIRAGNGTFRWGRTETARREVEQHVGFVRQRVIEDDLSVVLVRVLVLARDDGRTIIIKELDLREGGESLHGGLEELQPSCDPGARSDGGHPSDGEDLQGVAFGLIHCVLGLVGGFLRRGTSRGHLPQDTGL